MSYVILVSTIWTNGLRACLCNSTTECEWCGVFRRLNLFYLFFLRPDAGGERLQQVPQGGACALASGCQPGDTHTPS
eukprot:1187420-Prorocentrum_minimum.AAC.2